MAKGIDTARELGRLQGRCSLWAARVRATAAKTSRLDARAELEAIAVELSAVYDDAVRAVNGAMLAAVERAVADVGGMLRGTPPVEGGAVDITAELAPRRLTDEEVETQTLAELSAHGMKGVVEERAPRCAHCAYGCDCACTCHLPAGAYHRGER